MLRKLAFSTLPLCLLLAGCGGGSAEGPSLTEQYQNALKLSDPGQRSRRLAAVAEKQQQASDTQGADASLAAAKQAASEISDNASRAGALLNLAGSASRLGKSPTELQGLLVDAGKALDAIKDADAKVPLLADLAAAVGKYLKDTGGAVGYLKSAEEAAGTIAIAQAKANALTKVAVAFGQLGQTAEADRVLSAATEFAKSRMDPREQATCLAAVWSGLVSLKRTEQASAALAEARQIAEGIDADESRAYALLGIAQKCTAAGQKDVAGELLGKASAAADKVTDSSARGPLVDDIARVRKSL